jgi:flagellar basal body rod protein FlgG
LNATQTFTDGEENTGELKITHLDLTDQTISGTFFFDIVDRNGDLREIREGRFDMEFTQ